MEMDCASLQSKHHDYSLWSILKLGYTLHTLRQICSLWRAVIGVNDDAIQRETCRHRVIRVVVDMNNTGGIIDIINSSNIDGLASIGMQPFHLAFNGTVRQQRLGF
mmetsp:Transcript_34166/g.82824  ORF Transcript_34166/g.82824 Transcript_34166/m.82824 type:complete len:106 (+) Transcript_34166:291-608(+)